MKSEGKPSKAYDVDILKIALNKIKGLFASSSKRMELSFININDNKYVGIPHSINQYLLCMSDGRFVLLDGGVCGKDVERVLGAKYQKIRWWTALPTRKFHSHPLNKHQEYVFSPRFMDIYMDPPTET